MKLAWTALILAAIGLGFVVTGVIGIIQGEVMRALHLALIGASLAAIAASFSALNLYILYIRR